MLKRDKIYLAEIKGIHLLIEPTDYCNAKCIMCDQSKRHAIHNISKGFMEFTLFKKIVEDVKHFPIPIDAIDPLWAGESCLHPEFRNMLTFLFEENKKYKFFHGMVLNTNGTLFDRGYSNIFIDYASWIEKNFLHLKEGFFLHLYFSLEAASPETFTRIKGLSQYCYWETLNNIEYLLERRFKENLILPHLIFGFIVMEENIKEWKDFLNFWLKTLKKYNREVEVVNYFPFITEKDSIYFRKLISSDYSKATRLIKEVSQTLGLRYEEESPSDKGSGFKTPCGAVWKTPNICHNGTVVPCCRDINLTLDLGNIQEKSLTELWFGEKITKLRIAHITGNLDEFPICKECIEPESYISDEEIISYLKDINREDLIEIYLKRKEAFDKRDTVLLSSHLENKREVLNICLVSREYPPETGWGGIGRYTYLLAKGLAKRGHQVHVITQTFKDKEHDYIEDGVYVHRIKHPEIFKVRYPFEEFARRLEYSWRVYRKILELIDKYDIQIVEGPNFSAECFIYSLFKKTPLVTRIHTPYEEVIKNFGWGLTLDRRLGCWLEDELIRRSDIITCSTKIYANMIREKYNLKFDKVGVITLGIEVPDDIIGGEEEHNRGETLNVLFVGRLEKRKGIHILMQAIPEVLKEIPDIEFTIVGRDTFFQKDEASFESPEGKTFKTEFWDKLPEDIKNKVHLVGVVDNVELKKYYKSCDLFVAPSLHETFGYVYLEAMSYGKPVIGCKVGGVPEVIKDGEVGILVEPSNSKALAEAIKKAVRDYSKIIQMGTTAREYVKNNFSLYKLADETESLYKSIIERALCPLERKS